ncbi:MAG TPA: response regulator [Polyangiaceae bacterium]|nr:response regulator [Polyangiaceae bacterium]
MLVVDDEALVVDSLQRLLSAEFEISSTTRAAEALEWITGGESYDVILCDVMMPDLNGVELRNRIEELAPEQAARVVFVTGGLLLPHVRSMLDDVPNTVLEKPIDIEGLRELIRRRVRTSWQAPSSAI